jgi:2'-5' RNA ligase
VNTRRLFFAFWPDDALRGSLQRARQRLFPLSGRPVEVANLHITVAFLGAVAVDRVPPLQLLSGPIAPCEIELDRLELWGKKRVLVARASQVPQDLTHQVDLLWHRLGRLGHVRDPRPFKPHVTLVRDIQSLRTGSPWTPLSWRTERLQLMESVATPAGVRYEPVS